MHFLDGNVPRIAVVNSRSKIQAIFLNGSEDRFVMRNKRTGRTVEKTSKVPSGVSVRPRAKRVLRGPGKVCYLENGVLKCWSPS